MHQVKLNFGEGTYENGLLNRRYLAAKVFTDAGSTALLNSLVHPIVAIDFEEWVKVHQSAIYVVNEAALLIESGSYKKLDLLIVVDATEELRLERVVKRDRARSLEEIKAIMSKQKPQNEKVGLADFVIMNDESASLIAQVMNVHRKIIDRQT